MIAVLLPGLDGTGDLFAPFIAAAPDGFAPRIIALPERASYDELFDAVQRQLPREPFLLIAESFSGPLALRIARDDRVLGVVLCNTFVAPPVTTLLRFFPWSLLFAMTPPRWVIRTFFVGWDAPSSLVDAVRGAIAKTPRALLAARLRSIFTLSKVEPVDVPLLVLAGTRDRLLRMERHAFDALAASIAYQRIAAPHLLLQAAPAEAWTAIAAFAKTTSRVNPRRPAPAPTRGA